MRAGSIFPGTCAAILPVPLRQLRPRGVSDWPGGPRPAGRSPGLFLGGPGPRPGHGPSAPDPPACEAGREAGCHLSARPVC